MFDLSPVAIDLVEPGDSDQLSAEAASRFSMPPPSEFVFTSSDTTVATVSSPFGPAGGADVTVTAVGVGTAQISVQYLGQTDTASVVVYPGGTWSGSVTLGAGGCPGSDPAYNETAVISISASGNGSLTAKDTPGFDRPYSIAIPVSMQFTATGAFSINGIPVPGTISVRRIGPNQLQYTETTTYGNCSNTYTGVLTRR